MNNIVNINLHGELGNQIGKNYRLSVQSVGEACHAINTLTKNKFFKYLIDKDKSGQRYRVLINKKQINIDPNINKDVEKIKQSELGLNFNNNLESIDVVPILEGSKDFAQLVLGVVLVIVGVLISVGTLGGGTPLGIALVIGGLGLIAGGIITLLSSPPKFSDFREIDGSTGRTSYLFNGPENTTKEGGPVPVGYGNLIIGSQVISASYIIDSYFADEDGHQLLVDTQLADFVSNFK